jgi:hypothetical protein
MVCTLLTLIQYSIEISSQSNETRERNKSNSNKEGRSQIIPICRWYATITKDPEKC